MTKGMTAYRFFIYLIVGLALLSYRLAAAQEAGQESGSAPSTVLSKASDTQAKDAFLNTLFYADDRGLHQFPDTIDLFEDTFGGRAYNETRQVHAFRERKKIETKVASQVGLQQTMAGDDGISSSVQEGRFIGVYRHDGPHYSLGVGGCVLCHAGRAAGILVPGLGNKNVNLKEFAMAGLEFPQQLNNLVPFAASSPEISAIEASAARMREILSDPRFVSPTDGIIEDNIVMRTFFESFGKRLDADLSPHLNKVPQLWGIELKRRVGLFYDGAGDGQAAGWTVGPEIMWGQTAATIQSPDYMAKVRRTERLLNQFLPPPYPSKYPLDLKRALGQNPDGSIDSNYESGQILFTNTCSKCHGVYQKVDGMPVYQVPKLIPLAWVKTDPARAHFFANQAFWDAAAASDFKDLIKRSPNYRADEPSYFAPRLEGIWARFPYLHNGSVPTLWHMLHPSERPEYFSMKDAGLGYRFDPVNVGLTTQDDVHALELKIKWNNDRKVYWTGRPGQSSEGHPFGSQLTEDQKSKLIEYLKTL